MSKGNGTGSPGSVIRIFLIFAAIHSVLASDAAKAAASRFFGLSQRSGLYRFFYVIHAVVLTAWAAWRFVLLPDRDVYRIPAPWSWLMRLAQLLPISLLVSALRIIGLPRVTGFGTVLAHFRGSISAGNPVAQGPPLGGDGEMVQEGAFRYTRHPANFGPLPFFLFFPRMTVNRMTLAVLTVSYLVLGSVHEEIRLLRAYGPAYKRYQHEVSFFFGRWGLPEFMDRLILRLSGEARG